MSDTVSSFLQIFSLQLKLDTVWVIILKEQGILRPYVPFISQKTKKQTKKHKNKTITFP